MTLNPYSLIIFLYTEDVIEDKFLYKNISLTSDSGQVIVDSISHEASIINLTSDNKYWASISVGELFLDYVPHNLKFALQKTGQDQQVEQEEFALKFLPEYKEKKSNDIISAMMGI